jgi:SAM-dependent methyltransferase
MPSFISFIPTAPEHIKGFLNLVTFSPSDIVYDLGCGDGRLLFAALEKGAGKGVGVEIDPEPLKVARVWARKKGLEKWVKFYEADILKINLSPASVIFAYLSSAAARKLKGKFARELKLGTRVVMEMFPIPGWKPDQVLEWGTDFYLYTMPPVTRDNTPDLPGFSD